MALLLGLSWLLSYALGGAGRVPPHWFYVPVLVAAARFGLVGAAATAVVAGLLAGPLPPLDVAAGTGQHLLDWSGRLGFFLGVGLVMGAIRTGDGVEVQVRDQGPGIGPAFLGRAFEPFTQAHSSTTREHVGLGIGLFVARQLLHRLSGRIDLIPHERGGTVAVLHFPNLLQASKQAVTPPTS